jgi:hypothetical protein
MVNRPGQQLTFAALDEQAEQPPEQRSRHDLRAMMDKPLPPSDLPPLIRRNGKWVGRPFDLDGTDGVTQ